jgi:hypothetical protein
MALATTLATTAYICCSDEIFDGWCPDASGAYLVCKFNEVEFIKDMGLLGQLPGFLLFTMYATFPFVTSLNSTHDASSSNPLPTPSIVTLLSSSSNPSS